MRTIHDMVTSYCDECGETNPSRFRRDYPNNDVHALCESCFVEKRDGILRAGGVRRATTVWRGGDAA